MFPARSKNARSVASQECGEECSQMYRKFVENVKGEIIATDEAKGSYKKDFRVRRKGLIGPGRLCSSMVPRFEAMSSSTDQVVFLVF